MAVCANCEAIVPNQPGAPGHESLIQLGYVRALHQARRGVTHEAYTCADCGTDWDYLRDKRDPESGWRRCDRSAAAQELAAAARVPAAKAG